MEKIGVALVGCGEIAKLHAQALERSGMARLFATLDRDVTKAQTLANLYRAKVFTDLATLLENPEVEVIYILTRHDSHAEIALQALQAGKHIFCEKPLTLTLEEAIAIQRAANSANSFLMVGFNHRWNPAVRWARQWIEQKQTPIRSLQLTFATSHFLESWAGLAEEGGGVLVCLGSHALDLACTLVGETPNRLSAMTARLRLPHPYLDDTAALLMQFPSGAIGSLTIHDHAAPSYPNYYTTEPSRLVRAEIFGERWTIIIENSNLVHLFEQEARSFQMIINDPLEILGIQSEDEHFLKCISEGVQPIPDVSDGVRAVYLVTLAMQSAQSGCVQSVPYRDFINSI